MYGVPFTTMECISDANTNIEIYSPDLKYVKPLEVEGFDNIISVRISICNPPYSPDINPMDYSMWGILE